MMNNRQLKILVELTIDNVTIDNVSKIQANDIKLAVENNLSGSELPSYLHSLGNYLDAEVVKISLTVEHDTRQ